MLFIKFIDILDEDELPAAVGHGVVILGKTAEDPAALLVGQGQLPRPAFALDKQPAAAAAADIYIICAVAVVAHTE